MAVIQSEYKKVQERRDDFRRRLVELAPLQELAGSSQYEALERELIKEISLARSHFENLQMTPRDDFLEQFRDNRAWIRALTFLVRVVSGSFADDQYWRTKIREYDEKLSPGVRTLKNEQSVLRAAGFYDDSRTHEEDKAEYPRVT